MCNTCQIEKIKRTDKCQLTTSKQTPYNIYSLDRCMHVYKTQLHFWHRSWFCGWFKYKFHYASSDWPLAVMWSVLLSVISYLIQIWFQSIFPQSMYTYNSCWWFHNTTHDTQCNWIPYQLSSPPMHRYKYLIYLSLLYLHLWQLLVAS